MTAADLGPVIVIDGVTYETDGPPTVVHHGDGLVEITQRVHAPVEHITIHFSSPSTAIERGEEGTARAARRWSAEEAAQVERAIEDVARRTGGADFTTADVWDELGDGFPVTKGIASKMTAAARAGLIVNTGRHTFNDHPHHDHAHGQRLTVWRRS